MAKIHSIPVPPPLKHSMLIQRTFWAANGNLPQCNSRWWGAFETSSKTKAKKGKIFSYQVYIPTYGSSLATSHLKRLYVFSMVQRLTKDTSSSISTSGSFEDIDDAFLEKCTEFLRLFVSVHLRRFETSRDFPMMEFLALLFKYTFKQASPERKCAEAMIS